MSQPLRIAVYAIAKDEEAFTVRFLESAHDADVILVADTGSSDKTPILVRQYGEQWHPHTQIVKVHVEPWRFDVARNTALSLLPPDIDVCISLDMDEVLTKGWRKKIEEAWVPGTTRLRYGYDWGNNIVFHADKIHARKGYRWVRPVHEELHHDLRVEEAFGEVPTLLVKHLPNPDKPRHQYLSLLELGFHENPSCHRNMLYYARELVFHKVLDEAEKILWMYLNHPAATTDHERSFAMGLLATVSIERKDTSKALQWMRRAAAEAPHLREPWCALSWLCYELEQWEECYSSAHKVLAISEQPWLYTSNPMAWGPLPHDLLSLAAWNLGLVEEAIEEVVKAIDFDPKDPRLKENLKLFTEVTP